VAVNDFDGEVDFFKVDPLLTETPHSDGNPGASSLFQANSAYRLKKYIQIMVKVPCRTLDSVCNELGIGSVDLIWIDLQGAELKALKGFGKRLSDTRYIHVELTYKEIYVGQPLFWEVDDFLKSQGFERLIEPSENTFFEDIIYRNKALFQVAEDRVVLEQPWGGLGDNLQFSTLPELFARRNIEFYLSSRNKYRNTEILSTVWAANPYVKGILNEPASIGVAKIELNLENYRKDIPFIARIEMAHGFKPTNHHPIVYQKPRLREDLFGKVIIDLSSVSYSGGEEKLLRYLQATINWYKYRAEDLLQVSFSSYAAQKGLSFNDIPSIGIDSLADYESALYSASVLITVHSGAKSLAVALRDVPGARLQKIHSYASPMQYNFRNYVYDDVLYHVE
jgi:FkbM family methyltransferase